jgi:hypothetical protein
VLDFLLRPLLGRRTKAALPTTELYFSGPLHELVSSGSAIKPAGDSSFVAGKRGVVVRYGSKREIEALDELRLEKLYYVIDDDLFAAQTDLLLPSNYRNKLAAFTLNILPRILERAHEIIAPSQTILAAPAYGGHLKSLLDPAYIWLCPDFDHFVSVTDIRCVVLGTRSHRADTESIASAVLAALAGVPKLIVTTFLGSYAPPEFRNHPRITNRAPLPWPAFREVLRSERYHIALAPALPTDFNRARSISRLLDHAAFGAAGIYSNQPPFSERIAHGKDGILVDGGPGNWIDALITLATDLPKTEAIAAAGRDLAERLGNPERVRRFWHERLGTGA